MSLTNVAYVVVFVSKKTDRSIQPWVKMACTVVPFRIRYVTYSYLLVTCKVSTTIVFCFSA